MRLRISLVNNTKWHPISYHFRVNETYWSNYCFWHGVPIFNSLVRGEPWTLDGEIWPQKSRIITLSCAAQHISIYWTF